MECLNNIIGLMISDCECVTNGLTQEEIKELTTSKSGLFIDQDLNGVINLKAMNSKGHCANMVDYFKRARTSAINTYTADITASIATNNKETTLYKGLLGKPSFVGSLDVYETIQFFKIAPHTNSDAVVRVNQIKVGLDKTASIEVSVLRIAEGDNVAEVVKTYNVNAKGSQITNIETDIVLDLTIKGKKQDYFITYERPQGVYPLDLKADCGCGGNTDYEQHFSISGGETSDLLQLSNAKTTIYSHGILLDVSMGCEVGKLVCREYSDRNAISVTTAWAILYKTGANILDAILMSNAIDRYTTMNREALYGKRNHFNAEYNKRIEYISQTINVSSSDCFICSESKMSIGFIQV